MQRERKKSAVEPGFSDGFASNGFRRNWARMIFGCGGGRFQGSMGFKALFIFINFVSYPNFRLEFLNLPNLGGRSSDRRGLAMRAPVFSRVRRALISG